MQTILTHINGIPIKLNFIENLPYNFKLQQRARALRKAGNFPEVVFWKQGTKEFFGRLILTGNV